MDKLRHSVYEMDLSTKDKKTSGGLPDEFNFIF